MEKIVLDSTDSLTGVMDSTDKAIRRSIRAQKEADKKQLKTSEKQKQVEAWLRAWTGGAAFTEDEYYANSWYVSQWTSHKKKSSKSGMNIRGKQDVLISRWENQYITGFNDNN